MSRHGTMGHHCCRDSPLRHLVTDLHERQIAFVGHALFIRGALCSLGRMLNIVGMSRDELVDRARSIDPMSARTTKECKCK
jgi:hypothetical protein